MSNTYTVRAQRSSPVLRFLLRNFVLYNPLFLFSATMALGGAWLMNPPVDGGGRSLGLLFQLIALIQLYEFTLIGAGALLARKAGLERDVRNLMFVLSPFLLDVTFTSSSLIVSTLNQVGAGSAALLAGAIVLLAAVKAGFAAKLTGWRFSPLEWATLLAGPALVTLYPLTGAWRVGQAFQAEVGFVGGLLVGALVLLFGFAVANRPESLLRKLAPLALLAAVAHVSGTVWSYSGELAHVLGPVLIALGGALPVLAWPHAARRDTITPVVLPALGALACGAIDVFPFEVSGWQLGLVGFAAVQAVYLYRYRSLQFLAGVLLAAHLAWGGVGIGASLAAVGNNAVEPLALFALFGYGVWRRSHPVLLAAALGLGALFTARLELLGSSLDAVLALDLVGLGGLIWSKRVHGNGEAGARARFAAVFLLFVPVAALDLVESGGALGDASQLLSWGTVLALLVPAAVTRLRVYAFPALILPIQGAVALAPSSSVGWGLAGMIGAFALVSLGVFVSLRREQILAWLEDSSISDFEEGEPFLSTPASDTGWRHVVLAAGLLSAVGWVVLPVL